MSKSLNLTTFWRTCWNAQTLLRIKRHSAKLSNSPKRFWTRSTWSKQSGCLVMRIVRKGDLSRYCSLNACEVSNQFFIWKFKQALIIEISYFLFNLVFRIGEFLLIQLWFFSEFFHGGTSGRPQKTAALVFVQRCHGLRQIQSIWPRQIYIWAQVVNFYLSFFL